MDMENADLKKLQTIELEIFSAFIDVCKKLNLKYYLMGGTMLGAVRHKGFIPWDDDIDVGMMRKDYEFFCKEAQKLLPEKYFVQTNTSDFAFPANYCKIRDSETAFIETSCRCLPINHGAFIDVFPLDYYPENKVSAYIFDKRKAALSVRVNKAFSLEKRKKSAKTVCSEMLYHIATLGMNPYKALQKREKLYKSVKPTGSIANHAGAWGKREIVPIEWYGDGVEAEFEGLKVTIPTHYDLWLTKVYGDYMTPPPKEKRVTHHDTEVIDLEQSYLQYMQKEN